MRVTIALSALPAALAATCALTASAQAAKVDSTDGLLRYTAQSGETTNVDIRVDGDAIRVQEFPPAEGRPPNPLEVSGECQPVEPSVARCDLGRGEARVDMGVGGSQQLTIDDRLHGRIDGGQQLDLIFAGQPGDSLARVRPAGLERPSPTDVPARVEAASRLAARAAQATDRVQVAGRPGRGFTVDGNGGSDFVVGGRGDDRIELGPRGGVIIPGYGADDVNGGPDGSFVSYEDHTGDVTVDLRDRRAVQGERGERDRLANTPLVVGGQAGNTLTGDDDHNFLTGYGGTGGKLTGNGGHDEIWGNLEGSAGGRMLGGPGEDLLIANSTQPDVLDGGPGDDIDTAAFDIGDGFRIDLPNERAVGAGGVVDRISSVEWVQGSPGDDEIIGDERNNLLAGTGVFDDPADPGDDRVIGGPGSDDLLGGWGDDVLEADDGVFDFVSCGEEFDPTVEDHDRAVVDALDGVEPNCEQVTR